MRPPWATGAWRTHQKRVDFCAALPRSPPAASHATVPISRGAEASLIAAPLPRAGSRSRRSAETRRGYRRCSRRSGAVLSSPRWQPPPPRSRSRSCHASARVLRRRSRTRSRAPRPLKPSAAVRRRRRARRARAGGNAHIAAASNARDPACAATSAKPANTASPICAKAAARKATLSTNANTAKVPWRLSRMIASRWSRSAPPNSPSAESASPSSCNAPVSSRPAVTAKSAAGQSPSPISWAIRRTKAATAPMPAPTSGNAQAVSASCQSASAGVPIGMRVKKATAIANPAAKPGRRPIDCSGALIAATITEAVRGSSGFFRLGRRHDWDRIGGQRSTCR